MEIRAITPSDAKAMHELRLMGLRESPEAFGMTYDEEVQLTPEQVSSRSVNTADNFKVGAFFEDQLVGMGGFLRNTRTKRRHSGTIFGMYVDPDYRGQGIGRRILEALIQYVGTMDGVEKVTLDVVTANAGARRLYLSAGFETFGLEKAAMKQNGVSFDVEYMALNMTKP